MILHRNLHKILSRHNFFINDLYCFLKLPCSIKTLIFMKNIHFIIGLTILVFASCSQKISKLDYDKQAYEYQQLQLRYELLKKEKSGNTDEGVATISKPTIPATTNAEVGDYDALKAKYETLLTEKTALEEAYNATLAETSEIKETTAVSPPGSVPATTYKELQGEKNELEKKYVILQKRYETLKESVSNPTLNTAEYAEAEAIRKGTNVSKGVFEESSLRSEAKVVKRASYNGLYFEYDTYSKNNNNLILDIAVKNNSQSNLKTIWQTDKIQITDAENRTFTANSFRIGLDYVDADKNVLTKRIKDENTVFARFAFENIPSDFNLIRSLKFTVRIDGEDREVELSQLDIVEVR